MNTTVCVDRFSFLKQCILMDVPELFIIDSCYEPALMKEFNSEHDKRCALALNIRPFITNTDDGFLAILMEVEPSIKGADNVRMSESLAILPPSAIILELEVYAATHGLKQCF